MNNIFLICIMSLLLLSHKPIGPKKPTMVIIEYSTVPMNQNPKKNNPQDPKNNDLQSLNNQETEEKSLSNNLPNDLGDIIQQNLGKMINGITNFVDNIEKQINATTNNFNGGLPNIQKSFPSPYESIPLTCLPV